MQRIKRIFTSRLKKTDFYELIAAALLDLLISASYFQQITKFVEIPLSSVGVDEERMKV